MNAFKKTPAEVLGKFHPLFRGMTWVAAARSTDDTRFALTHVSVERENLITRIVATDGRRLHVHTYDAGLFEDDICDQMIEPGLYEIIAKSKQFLVIAILDDASIHYPNWRQVVPDFEPTRTDMINAQNTSLMSVRTGVVLASDFVKDACGFGCGAGDNIHVTYGSESPEGAFVITHEIGKAIVMPLKFAKDDDDEKKATGIIPGLERTTNEIPTQTEQ